MTLREKSCSCLFTAVLVSFSLTLGAVADTLYVAMDGNDTDNDGSETSPFATLAKAYDEAADTGDEIVVKPGTYVMSASLTVAKAVTIRSSAGVAEDVKIDGNKARRPIVLNHTEAKLLNVCVQNGYISSPSYEPGATVKIDAAGGVLEGCVIRGGNHNAYTTRGNGGGGGVACLSDAGRIVNCVITNNSINVNDYTQGGGLYMTKGKAVNCFIGYNIGKPNGNKNVTRGGGVSLQGSATLVNCTIAYNTCDFGGGLDVYETAAKPMTGRIVNCLIWGNKGDGDCADILGSRNAFDNCVAATPINDSCLVINALPACGGFLVPTVASPCVDASIPVEGVTLPALDINGRPRLVGGAADIGCSEHQVGVDADVRLMNSVGFAPLTVEFAVYTEGLTGITSYDWDFDGDGTVDQTTTEPTVSHTYEDCCAGVLPTVSFVHSGGPLTCPAPGKVSALPKTMYVNSKNKNPVAPYATPATAATSPQSAAAIAIDGQEIVLLAEGSPYSIKSTSTQVLLDKAVTLRGETGDPEDVIVNAGGYRPFRLNNPGAQLQSIAIQGANGSYYGSAIMVDYSGGTVSNCIVRNGGLGGYWTSATVYGRGEDAFITHCVISNNASANNSNGTTKGVGLEVKEGAVAANCLIANNRDGVTSTSTIGTTGGAYANGGYLRNCTIVDNKGNDCGGVKTSGAANLVVNCVIAGNVSIQNPATRANGQSDQSKSYQNCATDDAAAINATCQNAPAAELFSNYGAQDYTVAKDSVLIDNGADYEGMASKDLAGQKRVMGKAVDIGAYEYDNETVRLVGNFKADITKGFFPQAVTFTASVDGTNGTDRISYTWDFGDGTAAETTDSPVIAHAYAKGGDFTVKVDIVDVTSGERCPVVKPGLVYLVGRRMFVMPDTEGHVAMPPFDTKETASTNLTEAVDAALDGVEIVLLPGLHKLRARTSVNAALTIHGETGNPDDVVVRNAISQGDEQILTLNNARAFVYDATWENDPRSNPYRPCWSIAGQGGTISNCVIRGFRNGQYHTLVGALTIASADGLATHCVITNNTQDFGGNSAKAIVTVTEGRLENSLIAYNRMKPYAEYLIVSPLIRVSGAMVNCTIASNNVNAGSWLLHDWRMQEVSGGSPYQVPGSVTNCIFACNTEDGTAPAVIQTRSVLDRCNIADVDCDGDVPGWYRAADASEIFDAESAVSPWAIGLEAAHKFPGARRATADTTDLAGNPRYTGKRLDPGCYQCPKSYGLMLKVK